MNDCLIIGGGVIGLSWAWKLAQRGLKVEVVDRSEMGREASWAGAGIFPPPGAAPQHPHEQLRAKAHKLHPQWAKTLHEITGIDNGYLRCGGIYLARTAGEIASLAGVKQLFDEEKIEYQPLNPATFAQLEPQLQSVAETIRSAIHLPGEAQIRNPRHLKALFNACQHSGVKLSAGVQVHRIATKGRKATVVQTSAGDIEAAQIGIAAGAWTRDLLLGLKIESGIMPVRGQMILFRCATPVFSHILNEGPRYLTPRPDGLVLAGSTEEEAGFDKRNTPEALDDLKSFAISLVPALAAATVEKTWAGLRPGSFDGLPYMGRVSGYDNVFVSAGHYRSGLHLSPAVTEAMVALMCGEQPGVDLSPFHAARG